MPVKTNKSKQTVKEKQSKPASKNHAFFIAVSIAGIIIGMVFAFNLKWVGDDIFIGLRYIDNFLAGNGLVYNTGERIEGYTNFSWIMLITLFQYLKFDAVEASLNLGILFTVCVMVVVVFISFRANVNRGVKYFVPLSLLMLALNYDFAVWATGGLETMLYAFLLIAAFGFYFFTNYERNTRLFITGLLLCVALFTRPDAAIFFALANAFLLLSNLALKKSFKKLFMEQLLLASTVMLLYIPYFIMRYTYYGQFFPNTYYSKAGYDSFYSRGFYYLWLYAECHFTSFLFFLSFPVLLKMLFAGKGNSKADSFRSACLHVINNKQESAFTMAVISITLYLLFFVAKVGGDFMYARFVVPCVPFIAYVIEYTLYALPAINYKKHYTLITLLIVAAVITESKIRVDLFLVEENGRMMAKEKKGIADERYVYVNQYKLSYDKKVGIALQPYFKDLDANILVRGGQACFVYYGKFKYCLEDHGLTDTVVSHLPIKERGGKIAHEKSASYEYMLQRRINFVFRRSLYKNDQYRLGQFSDGTVGDRFEIITYNRNLMKALKQRIGEGFQYTDFEAYLDYYIANVMPTKSKEDIQKDYKDFKEYYFTVNDDKEREAKFLSKI